MSTQPIVSGFYYYILPLSYTPYSNLDIYFHQKAVNMVALVTLIALSIATSVYGHGYLVLPNSRTGLGHEVRTIPLLSIIRWMCRK